MTAIRPRSGEQTALGRELRRIRTDVLQLTGPKMAAWLGVDTFDTRGRPTSTGKSLVSRFESGARLPDETVIDQYANAPAVDVEALRRLWAEARAADGSSTGTATPAAEPDLAPDPVPMPAPEFTPDAAPPRTRVVVTVKVVLIVGVVAALAAGSAIVWTRLRQTGLAPAGVQPSVPSAPSPLTTPVRGVTLVFDALGVTSDQTIRIYHGPGGSASDRTIDGTYESGQAAAVVCITEGRRVTSDPHAGEAPKTSDQWARIVASDGRISYATMTYARISPLTASVPLCGDQPLG